MPRVEYILHKELTGKKEDYYDIKIQHYLVTDPTSERRNAGRRKQARFIWQNWGLFCVCVWERERDSIL